MQGTAVLSWSDAANLKGAAVPGLAARKNSVLGLKPP